MIKIKLLLGILLISTMLLSAQERQFIGTVKCFNTFPISGVEIKATRTKNVVYTDSNGVFVINIQEKGEALILKAKGFSALRYVVKDQDSATLNMVYVDTKKNREMVTAYGYISPENLTYAMTNLKNENNEFQNYRDIYDIFTNTMAGVTVNYGTHPPSINIRNSVSLYADTQPLFIVDGMPVPPEMISSISPEEIKEISVIKDGETAAYGTRGANGVIIIVLKGR